MSRILLTVHKFFPEHRAGTEVLTLKVAQELQQRGHKVLVLTADPPDVDARHAEGPLSRTIEYGGIEVCVVGESLRLQGYSYDHEFDHPAIAEHANNVLEQFVPDLVHMFHLQNLSASIIPVAKRRGIPIVFSATDFWFVCPIVQLKRPDGSVCRGPGDGGRNCLSCYTPHLIPRQDELIAAMRERFPFLAPVLNAGLAGKAAAKLLHELYAQAKLPGARRSTVKRPGVLRQRANMLDAIMVPTQLMRDIFVENGINDHLISLVPFGIDTSSLEIYRTKQPASALRIGFIGTLFEHKGPDLLIEAFAMLPGEVEAELRIYGDPQQFPEYGAKLLQQADKSLRRKDIHFCGTFPNEQLGRVLQQLDVLVVPSRWYENTPLVIQSSLATGTPLIATNLGGMAELVRHEENGLLFELNNPGSLYEQLSRLATDGALLERLRANIGPERTIAQMVDDIEKVYAGLPAGSRQRSATTGLIQQATI